MTFWPCPVPTCREPRGLGVLAWATPTAFARAHQGLWPDSAELAAWQRQLVTDDLARHLAEHSPEELSAIVRVRCAPMGSLAPAPNPGTVTA